MSVFSVKKRLKKVYQTADTLLFDQNSKFIIMSDCHRGQGNAADNFFKNQNIYFGALHYYYQNNFTYIELGDGDELWENRKIEPIIDVHSDVFWLLSEFYRQDRFYMFYGNHDIIKSKTKYIEKHCSNYYCDSKHCYRALFPGMQVQEGLILENIESGQKIFLAHGHQGDLLNDTFWPLARFLVRYFWNPLELVGFLAPIGAGRAHQKKDKVEKSLAQFADEQKSIFIAGHTHRPQFPYPGDGFYFNDGSCVHPRCITGIEIENNHISLIKWSVNTREDQSLYVGRHILEGPVSLIDYLPTRY